MLLNARLAHRCGHRRIAAVTRLLERHVRETLHRHRTGELGP
jgi:hypothetical protein